MHTIVCGSSPRMWGTQAPGLRPLAPGRFIPTHVGNTRSVRIGLAGGTVHPHACGEHPGTEIPVGTAVGSSPRMWGTHGLALMIFWIFRFIPTHVGNTHRRRRRGRGAAVHPHACGEHISRSRFSTLEFGSSPRMWGTHLQVTL